LAGASQFDGYCWWLPELSVSEPHQDAQPTLDQVRAEVDRFCAAIAHKGAA
jgi:hypothetical protein